MSRQKTKTSGLIFHAKSNGTVNLSEREILYKKFVRGIITKDELRKYVNFLIIERNSRRKTTVTVKFGGKAMVLTMEEYNKYYVPAYGKV